MKNYLSSPDLAMWIALFVGQVVLCLCILKKRFSRRLRWFSIFIFFATGKDVFLFALAFWSSYPAYYYAFYAGSYIESVLVFVTLIECGRQVLPGLNLPQKERAFSYLFGALAAEFPRKQNRCWRLFICCHNVYLHSGVFEVSWLILVAAARWHYSHSWISLPCRRCN
jgi:hypothetical protein